ncbi:Glycine dehydrogenase [decarboxylating] [Candidatus Ornithobacterium hominis]|uniref:aminomethyl-transferring glycine dehydrogenase n=1 Tax=Candidatus Ornithobacterium hominis TaxID=2497989 RepID=UPI000E5AFD55|nr:aminomethyl-transferring glycine dehydrogenase [Candidatus Ornithobacterium hominis]SZD73087.1 Glycine dehydrogenase [decarboxylating] [Candidatus Ornithobacterium hominis]
MNTNDFSLRHIGVHGADQEEMLKNIGASSIDQLINEALPENIRISEDINLPNALTELELSRHMQALGSLNKIYRSYIGFGYHNTILPPVIQRNILENPGWYTAYTPYQAEIAQGRLQALLNFQTMVSDLTALPIANASLLDEGTAAAEAMSMFFSSRTREQKKNNVNKFFVSDLILPQTLSVLETKASGLGIEIVTGNHENIELTSAFFGALVQYPGKHGELHDYSDFVEKAHHAEIQVAMAADILSLVLLRAPGEFGVDAAIGTTQRFGIPMGFGGPHAAYMACQEKYKREIPGRIIGLSQDSNGKPALRMALQTREQHIKRQKATSNICTAQVLLAVMAGMYAVYHGPNGLKYIAETIHKKAVYLAQVLKELNFEVLDNDFFDTIRVSTKGIDRYQLKSLLESYEININFFHPDFVSISLDDLDVATDEGFKDLISGFAKYQGVEYKFEMPDTIESKIPKALKRSSDFLTHENFNLYHTETELMRYIKRLEKKDLALNHSMIPLGSCTMKLNAAAEMLPLSKAEFGSIHPFAPQDQTQGYLTLINNLENYLSEITGFASTSLQPNSGAQGEYAGLMVIKEYLKSIGQTQRNVVVIPESAHGTNPASAVLTGLNVVIVKNLENGEFDIEDLKAKVEKHKNELAALMVTYPSTYGFFDDNIKEVIKIIHENGGQVYMDGANMNAQVGLTNPYNVGADVCHLNLHKTFAIPHGGGGPGVGPICVAEHLKEFLPGNPNVNSGSDTEKGLYAISSAPFGSALIHSISYSYIRLLGSAGLKRSTQFAILNANYLKKRLETAYDVLFTNKNGRVAHEMIIDFRPFKKYGIEVVDIAKRLMDYGFHAPTVSFPVAGTLMIEPTESESKAELDRFVEALLEIKKEIDEIANGNYPEDNNVLKNAPHTTAILTADKWSFGYSRQKAAYPLEWVRERKFWPSVSRIDDAYGDRNLICTCPPTEDYK